MMKIIWAHPCIGKTYITKLYPNLFLDLDEEYKGQHMFSVKVFKREGDTDAYNRISRQIWETAKIEAAETNRVLLTSRRYELRKHYNELDIVLNIPYETFIERVTLRQIISVESAISWKNDIENLLKKNSIPTLNTKEYFANIPFIKKIIEYGRI